MKYRLTLTFFCFLLFIVTACFQGDPITPGEGFFDENGDPDERLTGGCDLVYPALDSTPYVLPFPIGEIHPTGLGNCSSSFHAADRNDNLAYDFDMPYESVFTAIHAGTVEKVVEDQSTTGGDGAGNFLVVRHTNGTFGLYYHSPFDGIIVEEGDVVRQGQELGYVGRSGYAGYPHLHLIVVSGRWQWPYSGVPISFRNVEPPHRVLESFNREGYEALPY